MASLADLGRERAGLDDEQIGHLQLLLRSWGLLADLSFSDLLLFLDDRAGADRFVVAAHVRPTTGQTIYRHDPVGDTMRADDRPVVATAFAAGTLEEGQILHPTAAEAVRVTAIPVRHRDRVIAVVTREALPPYGRASGELERTYQEVFERMAGMIAAGVYPFAQDAPEQYRMPRVGDGAMVLDGDGRVVYSSPNAVSALHRLGVHRNAGGLTLAELGLDQRVVRRAYQRVGPEVMEMERGRDTTVVVHCIPLIEDEAVIGAILLVRDVSDLRRRERLLLSKDATIQEIHHRVKNNLQTIASLLRIQSRRLRSPEAVTALEESVRRIASIALVHETLAQDTGATEDEVRFVDVVRPLVRMVEEGLVSEERPVRFRVEGDAGQLPAQVAMPLAVVLTELLQNAVEHAFPDRGGEVVIGLDHDRRHVRMRVIDDGVGVPEGFDVARSDGLGMTIMRTFVCGDLGGTIDARRRDGSVDRSGTVVELEVPLSADAPEVVLVVP